MRFIKISLLVLVGVFVFGMALLYGTIPFGNTDDAHFDAIIVLGYPANPDGTVSPIERARVMEGIKEFRRGIASVLIMTGGAAHNEHTEAEVMADFARSQGVPDGAIIRENQALNTIQNAYYSVEIMKARGWKAAEVVSSDSHIRRASLIFRRFPIAYRVHGAPNPPETGILYDVAAYIHEIHSADHIRLFGFTPDRFIPR